MAAGSDVIIDGDDAGETLTIPREFLATEAADPAYLEVVRFLQFKRAGRTTDAFLVEFDVLRRKAESKVETAGAFPGAFVPGPCVRKNHSVRAEHLRWSICACGTPLCRDQKNHRRWPVRRVTWASHLWQSECVDFSAHVAVQLVRTL